MRDRGLLSTDPILVKEVRGIDVVILELAGVIGHVALAVAEHPPQLPLVEHQRGMENPVCDLTGRAPQLKRGLPGITDVMLSKCLNELEQNNLIVRYQYDCIPPKVEYFLSERGKPLIPVLYSIHEWGQTQMDLDTGEAGRQS